MSQLLQSFQMLLKGKRLNAGLLRTPGARLLAIRKDMGLTQPEFAKKMEETWKALKKQGVSGTFTKPGASTISDWETDTRRIPREVILVVAEMWKTTTDFLLCAPWVLSEHRTDDANGKPTFWHEDADHAASLIDVLEPGLRRMVVRKLPGIIEDLRADWQAQINTLAEMRQQLIELRGEEWVAEWERRKGKALKPNADNSVTA